MNENSFKESLRCFLEEYKNSNGALKYLDFVYRGRSNNIVTEQSGIQITVYSNKVETIQ